jgi:hypothetical protein
LVIYMPEKLYISVLLSNANRSSNE